MSLDVAVTREQQRRKRLRRVTYLLIPVAVWLWYRIVTGNPVSWGLPSLPDDAVYWLPGVLIIALIGLVLIAPMAASGRSPHVTYLPEQIPVGFSDVKGLGSVVAEVQHTLSVFLEGERFSTVMGGTPRRGVLFEGPPGTGKTHIAKAMAKEAGVPFLFVSSTAFQSMWYGATARKIRAYFRQLRKTALKHGGAIGFIEEIDAIGGTRGGMNFSPATATTDDATIVNRSAMSEGVSGVVNELLVQMQSFDSTPWQTRTANGFIRFFNSFLPMHRQIKPRRAAYANILIIGATNRADKLDPALLRPGRFDRILHFDLPGKPARRELVDYFLARKSHTAELDQDPRRDDVAAATMGYTPAAMERLFDEALLVALRDGRNALTFEDMRQARMEVEIGLPQPTDYPADERETIAVHEAGHAVAAYLAGKGRRLEVLSIIKRRSALGLLAHRDTEERFTRNRSEMEDLLCIALGGMVAEELFFGESGTGPAGDLQAATKLGAEMVGAYGLGGSLVSFNALDPGIAGGNLVNRVMSDDEARGALNAVLDKAKGQAIRMLGDNRFLIEALRDALLEKEEIVESEILSILHRAEERAAAEGRVLVDLTNPNRPLSVKDRIELMPEPEAGIQ